MLDGLYLNDTWVAEVEAALTIVGNDLTKPDSLEFSYSNSFTLPDTLLIRDLLENAEQIDSGGADPYRQIPAYLIVEGEEVFTGVVELTSFQGGWKVNLLDSMVPLFDSLSSKSLSQLDLSRLDHPWTFDGINSHTGSRSGVVYPFIDYGGFDGAIVPYDTMCPAIYCKTIALQIIHEAGYRAEGDWLDDPFFLKMALPFVEDQPKSHDEDWKNDRTARVTANKPENIKLSSGHPIDVYLPLNFDNLPLDGFEDGRMNCYKAEIATYVCPDNMFVNAQANILFFSIIRYGAPEINLSVERNGQNAGEATWSEGGYRDHLTIGDSLNLDVVVECRKGDQLRIRLTGSSRTKVADYAVYFSQQIGEMHAAFIPDTRIHFGDTWIVSGNLPDLSCSAFMVALAKIMCGSYRVDTLRKSVSLVTFDQIIANLPQARDWSTKVEESDEPIHAPTIEGYGQRNLLQWKELDEKLYRRDKVSKLGYGDGVLLCEAKNMPAEAVLFELPFAPCGTSDYSTPAYGSPIQIKTRLIKGTGENQTVDTQSATPRIILVEYNKIVPVNTKEVTPDGAERVHGVTLTPCWWGIRPDGAKTEDNAYSLSFANLPTGREQWLLDRYFKGLIRVLRRPRTLTTSTYLYAEDVATLDLSMPIRLKQVRLGSLDINDNYFYLNQIKGYQSGSMAQTVLIAIS